MESVVAILVAVVIGRETTFMSEVSEVVILVGAAIGREMTLPNEVSVVVVLVAVVTGELLSQAYRNAQGVVMSEDGSLLFRGRGTDKVADKGTGLPSHSNSCAQSDTRVQLRVHWLTSGHLELINESQDIQKNLVPCLSVAPCPTVALDAI